MRVLIIQFLPGYADFLEHLGELFTLVVGEGTKGLLSKANAGCLLNAGLFPSRIGQADGELPTVFGIATALDKTAQFELGQNLGKGPRLEVEVHAELLLGQLAGRLLGE